MDETKPEPAAEPKPDRRDEDGLPVDRAATIDDVRGGENHFKLAVGCSGVVLLLIVAFFVLRVVMAH